jgi:hypothetical protein
MGLACRLAVDFAPMADLEYDNCDGLVVYSCNNTVITSTILPKLTEAGTIQRFAYTSRVVEWGYPSKQEFQDSI